MSCENIISKSNKSKSPTSPTDQEQSNKIPGAKNQEDKNNISNIFWVQSV